MIRYPLSIDERIRLITSIFSDPDEVEVVEHLSGDDAQTFIDTIDKASSHTTPRSNTKDRQLTSFETFILY